MQLSHLRLSHYNCQLNSELVEGLGWAGGPDENLVITSAAMRKIPQQFFHWIDYQALCDFLAKIDPQNSAYIYLLSQIQCSYTTTIHLAVTEY